MKRIASLVLCVLLLCALFSGCNKDKKPAVSGGNESSPETKPLQVLIEPDVGAYHTQSNRKMILRQYAHKSGTMYKSFLDVIEELGGPERSTVKLEYLPLEGTDRELALTALQTEIMAGGGPDVYVSFAGTGLEEPTSKKGIQAAVFYSEETPVIPYPQQAMERGMFLNLDDYLPKAQFMKLENLPEPLAEAGQYEGNQYILPMSYTIRLMCFDRKETEQPELSDTMTWEEMINESSLFPIAAGSEVDSNYWSGSHLWPLVENGKLAFTEEELLDYVTERWNLYQKLQKENDIPAARSATLSLRVLDQLTGNPKFEDCKTFTAIPAYSRTGGYGALIKTYAAINANTERPEDAFFIVDYLLSEECQTSEFYLDFCNGQSVPSMTGEAPLAGFSDKENHKTYCDLRKHVAFAEFDTPLHFKIGEILYYVKQDNGKNMESLVHEGYSKMRTLLDEA